MNDQPLENIEVIRRWELSEIREQRSKTDDDGYSEFPAVFEFSLIRYLPIELVIAQGLYVVVDGVEYKIWSYSKRNPYVNGEFNDRPINLSCEITNDLETTREFGSLMRTRCTW